MTSERDPLARVADMIAFLDGTNAASSHTLATSTGGVASPEPLEDCASGHSGHTSHTETGGTGNLLLFRKIVALTLK